MLPIANNKTIESYKIFKGIYEARLEDEGFILADESSIQSENPFEGMKTNTRLLNAMKDFEVHTAPDYDMN